MGSQSTAASTTVNMICRLLFLSAVLLTVSARRFKKDTGYGPPEPSYNEPEPAYGAPEPAYGAPEEPAYGAPESSEYSAPAYSAPGDVLELSNLVVPVLVIVALLLLFPNYINLTTVRRSFKEEGPVALFDKVKDIAQAVLEDDSVLTKYD